MINFFKSMLSISMLLVLAHGAGGLIGFNMDKGKLGIPSSQAQGHQTDSLGEHVDSALAILKQKSLYANRVNWKEVTQKVHAQLKGMKTKAETFSALRVAFTALADKHAIYYHYDNQFRISNTALTSRYSDSLLAEWKKGPRLIAQMIGRQAYLRIPYMGAVRQADIDKMANEINDQVRALADNNPEGWVIDLRLNAGGNIRPMMAGLGSFFSDGTLGYYIDRNGKAQERSSIYKGKFMIDAKQQAFLKHETINLTKVKVAVLIGPGTGSSGEALALNFQQRASTALFGKCSAGLANATNGFVFSHNQAYFLISVSRLGDKHKKVLPEYVNPDFSMLENDHFSDLLTDTVTKHARAWLGQSFNNSTQ